MQRKVKEEHFVSPLELGDASPNRVRARLARLARCDEATIARYASRWPGSLYQLEAHYKAHGQFPNEVRD